MFQGFWKFRPQMGVAVKSILFENLNISGTGVGTTLKVGACNHLKKILSTCFRIFGISAHKWAWKLMQLLLKTSISPAAE